MPYISFKTNHKLTLRQENMIKEKSGELISLIPGKSEKALMIHMEDDQIMYFKGEELTCMMIEINLYRNAEFEDKKKLTEAMIQMIHETTKIVYLGIEDKHRLDLLVYLLEHVLMIEFLDLSFHHLH